MERNLKVRRSSLFLLELMITILLFSVNSAVCIRVFAQAHQESEQARLLTEAASACSGAAELLRAADSPRDAQALLEKTFPAGHTQGETRLIPQEDGASLEISGGQEAGLYRAEIRYLLPDGSCVYSLTVDRYFPEVSR